VQITRITALLFLAAGYPGLSAAAQWTREPVCDKPGGNVIACALHAGRVADLRDGRYAPDEREVRFWTVSGMSEPEQVLMIHQRGDSVTGRLLLIWTDSVLSDSFATATCTKEMWHTAAGSLCVGRLSTPRNWAIVLKELDDLGLSQLPGSPVPIDPCYRTPSQLRTPPDRVCGVLLGGMSNAIEVRTSTVYWRYAFQRVPDTTAAELKRDNAILRLLSCVATKAGDLPC